MIKAITDRVFIKLPPEEEKTSGGIIIDYDGPNRRNIGVVISVGEKVRSIKKGDKVLFHIFDDLPGAEKDVVVVRESSILGVISDD